MVVVVGRYRNNDDDVLWGNVVMEGDDMMMGCLVPSHTHKNGFVPNTKVMELVSTTHTHTHTLKIRFEYSIRIYIYIYIR